MRSTLIRDAISKIGLSWISLILVIIAIAYGHPVYAQPKSNSISINNEIIWQPYLVNLTINKQDAGSTVVWKNMTESVWLLPIDTLKRFRIQIPVSAKHVIQENTEFISTESFGNIKTQFSEEKQWLSIDLEPKFFESSSVKLRQPNLGLSPVANSGTVINYDLLLSSSAGSTSEYVFTELNTSAGSGVFLASQAYLHDGVQSRFIRLDTNYTLDLPEKLTTLRLGDAISRPATTLGRAVRFAGIQYRTNFLVQPGLITAPVASLSGQAALPSVVDLYINNVLQTTQSIPPGPFSITAPPVIAGDGEILMKIRDISGREELVSGRFYSTPYLLAPGLSDFSIEAGSLRKNYAFPEDSYGSLFSSASYRRGLTDRLTAEVGLQGSTDGPKNILASATRLIPSLGTFNLATAFSSSDAGAGSQFAIGFERRSGPTSLSARTEHADDKFQQIGVDRSLVMRRLDSAFWNYRLDGIGNIGVSYTRYERMSIPSTRVLGLSFSTFRSGWGSLLVSAFRTEGPENGYSLGLFWVIPTSRDISASAMHSTSRDSASMTVFQAQKSAPYGEGIGWRLQAAINAAQQAAVVNQTKYGLMRAEIANYQDETSARAGFSGSAVHIDEQWFLARRVTSSYGLVKLPGLNNVRIYVDNQLAANTNELGYALLPNLHPYIQNHVSVEQLDLPMDTRIGSLLTRPVPMWRRGLIIDFPIQKISAATLRLVDQDGQVIPAGASVRVEGSSENHVVGRDGLTYIEGLTSRTIIHVSWGQKKCTSSIPLTGDGEVIPYLGEFQCSKGNK